MKITKCTIVTIIFWGLVNIGLIVYMQSNDYENPTEVNLAPELVSRFDTLRTLVLPADSNKPIEFQARILKPDRIEARRFYPLIVALHGAGERGNDNQRQLKYLPQQMAQFPWQEKYPCFLLAPQCPRNMNWSSPARAADSPDNNDQNLLDQIHQMILDISRKYPIDKRRIYITGYSMGGFGTWSMIARYPDLFAAAVPICGGGNTNTVSGFVHLPIWVAHGTRDEIVPVTSSRDMVDAFCKAGGNPIYQELEGIKHDSWTATYAIDGGMFDWLFQQRKK